MKRFLSAAVAVAGLALSSSAGAQQWDGPEIGIQGGYGWGNSSGDVRTFPGGAFDILPYNFSSPGGVLGGAHAGYMWQFGPYVLGLEGDAEGADVAGSRSFATVPSSRVTSSMDFDASVRGKLGVAVDRVLLYGTGGVAFGDVETKYQSPIGNVIGAPDGIRVGWTGGAGVDYAVTPNWELGVEYRYTDLGSSHWSKPFPVGLQDTNSFTFNAVRLALTYRFAPPPPSPPPVVTPAVARAPPPAARTFLVFFDFDRYDLTAEGRLVADQAAKTFHDGGHARIELGGYTDLAGTQEYNLRLSRRRADTVAAYLVGRGVPKTAMDVKWFGKEHPRVATPDGVRDPDNRRVEIVMP